MLQSFEAVIDENGNISIPETVRWRRDGRAVVVLLDEGNAAPPRKSGTIEVRFLHPRNITVLVADISPQCTGAEALQELQADDGTGAFLTPPQTGEFYGLVLKRDPAPAVDITPNMTFAQAGVQSGDMVEVRLGGQGGGPTPAEVVQLVFASAAVALAFLKAARPIVLKLLETRFRIEVREGSVVVEGEGATSVNRAIEVLKTIVQTDGLNRLETKAGVNGSLEAAKTLSLQPAAQKKDRAGSKRRSTSGKSPAGKTTKKGSASESKSAGKKSGKKRRA